MTDLPPPEDRVKDDLIGMVELYADIIRSAENNGYQGVSSDTITEVAKMINDETGESLTRGFIKRSVQHWPMVKNKEYSFFVNHAFSVFKDVPEPFIVILRKLFTDKGINGQPFINDDDMQDLFAFCSSLITNSISYLGQSIEARLVLHQYLPPDFDLAKIALEWKVSI